MVNRGDLFKYALLPELAMGAIGATAGKLFMDSRIKPYSRRYHPKVIGRMYNMEHQKVHGRETGIADEELGKRIQQEQSEYDGSPRSAVDHTLGYGAATAIGGLGAAAITAMYRGM